jgi:hypothetical protein
MPGPQKPVTSLIEHLKSHSVNVPTGDVLERFTQAPEPTTDQRDRKQTLPLTTTAPEQSEQHDLVDAAVIGCQVKVRVVIELLLSEKNPLSICAYCMKPNQSLYRYGGRFLCEECSWEIAEQGGF